MKITEMIGQLEVLYEKYGNHEVYMLSDGEWIDIDIEDPHLKLNEKSYPDGIYLNEDNRNDRTE